VKTLSEPLTYNVAQAAAKLGVSAATVRKRVSTTREWPCTRFGRYIRFTDADITTILAICQQPAVARKQPRRRNAA
jgi:hypothetical protein